MYEFFLDVSLTPLMLKKHPQIVRNVEKLTRYVNKGCVSQTGEIHPSPICIRIQRYAEITLNKFQVNTI